MVYVTFTFVDKSIRTIYAPICVHTYRILSLIVVLVSVNSILIIIVVVPMLLLDILTSSINL